MTEVIVIGGGVGGLSAAIRLAAAGYCVQLCERRPVVGGKLDEQVHAGYAFETGPSLLTLPFIFDAVFQAAGTTLADEVDLVRLDPICTYHWSDGSRLAMPAHLGDAVDAVEEFSPGSGAPWRAFIAKGLDIWETSYRTFFAGPMDAPRALLRRAASPRDLLRIDPFRSLDRAARASFDDPRLVQLVDRYATYSGSSPFRAPATLACIPAIEMHYGAWYVMGGLTRLRDALVRVADKVGVEMHTDSPVERILDDGTQVTGVALGSGRTITADVVIANVDADHLYRDLMPDASALRAVEGVERSSSGYVVLAAVEGHTDGLGHHNIVFSNDYGAEFEAMFDRGRPAAHPTVYACVSSVTDATQAPAGGENWFLLANAPSQPVAWAGERYDEVMLDAIAPVYPTLRERIVWRETITPDDIASRFRTAGGAIYGTSSNGMRAAFKRPANRGPRRGLYLVGGSSHPGGGLPLVAQSGAIVAGLVASDYPRG